jgi:hypothetical protein
VLLQLMVVVVVVVVGLLQPQVLSACHAVSTVRVHPHTHARQQLLLGRTAASVGVATWVGGSRGGAGPSLACSGDGAAAAWASCTRPRSVQPVCPSVEGGLVESRPAGAAAQAPLLLLVLLLVLQGVELLCCGGGNGHRSSCGGVGPHSKRR